MFKLVIADDEGKTTTVPLVRDEITIGRKEGNTIRLTDRNVSRRHARLQKQNGHYLLQDLGSYNGIVINGARLSDARPLRHGDQILIGDYKLAITEEASAQASVPMPPGTSSLSNGAAETLAEAPAADVGPKIHPAATEPGIPSAKVSNGATASAAGPPPVPQSAAGPGALPPAVPARTSSPPPSMPQLTSAAALTVPPPAELPEDLRQLRLVFLSPHGVPPPVVLERLPLILGRSEAADIALPFPSISREHARLFAEGGQLMIEDLGSSNGILINGEKLPRTRITPGDLVTLGVVEFRVARRGDSTMVVYREAEAQKAVIARRSPFPVIGGVLGGGVVLGLIVFVMMRGGLSAHVDTPPPAVISPAPVVGSVVPTVVAAPSPTTASPTPEPPTPPTPTEPVAPTPTEPVQPAVAVVPTPPDPMAPVAVEPHAREPENHASSSHPSAHVPTHHASENAVAGAQPYVPPTPANPPTVRVASSGSTSNAASANSTASAAVAPPADLMTAARTAARSSDNATVVHLLEGHATTEPELGLLAVTYRTMGNRPAAERTMRRYLTRFPNGPRNESFHDYIDAE